MEVIRIKKRSESDRMSIEELKENVKRLLCRLGLHNWKYSEPFRDWKTSFNGRAIRWHYFTNYWKRKCLWCDRQQEKHPDGHLRYEWIDK